MGLQITNTVSALAVFVQGILSFFSPCVLPLVPVYLSYLAGDAGTEGQPPRRRRLRLLTSTLFFVLGISFAIFTLGMGVSALGQFFSQSRQVFTVIGGLVLIVLGLVQLGLFGRHGFSRELRLPFRIQGTVNPFTALLLGFTFSFAWTPCVGPALASVLVMAGSASSAGLGFAYIGLYTLGFVLPFLALGFFADALLSLLRRSQKALAWTGRIGAVLLIAMGVLLLAGWVTSDTFRSDFLHRKGNPRRMVLMRVSGDSMVPEIQDNDLVLLDQGQTEIVSGRLYAIGFEDAIYIKRIDLLPGQIVLHSTNPAYPPVTLDLSGDCAEQFRVIGRVLWSGREYR